MSSAGADCVIALVDTRSAPVAAYGRDGVERDAARDLHERVRPAAVAHDLDALRGVAGRHVVEHHDVGAGRDGLLHLVGPVALDLDAAARPQLAGPATAARDRSCRRGGCP